MSGQWAININRDTELPAAPGAGLTSEDEGVPFLLEAAQGDRISGKISRAEVASVAVAALATPASVGALLLLLPALHHKGCLGTLLATARRTYQPWLLISFCLHLSMKAGLCVVKNHACYASAARTEEVEASWGEADT
jgi:hypothetical protein